MHGDTFYVNKNDPNASDGNDGLSLTYISGTWGPWRTIKKASSSMNAGDITYVTVGVYEEVNITFQTSGTDSAPIVLSAYGYPGYFDKVVIDGSLVNYPVGIYIADTTSNIVIQGITIRNMKYGILTDDPGYGHHRNIVIRDVTVHNNGFKELSFPGAGMYLPVLNGFVLESVHAYDNAGDGISVIGGGAYRYSENGYIINCISHDNDDGKPLFLSDAHGIAINQARNIAICNCVAYGNLDHGIDVSDWPKGDSLSHHITLENNIASRNAALGFALNSDSHHVLHLRNLAYGNYVGFMCYSGCGRVEYYHNVSMRNRNQGFVVDTSFAVFENPGDNSLIFRNNIAFANDTIQYNYAALEVDTFNLEYQVTAECNNLHISPPTSIAAYIGPTFYYPYNISMLGPGNLSTDPGFRDPFGTTPDVSLIPGSQMIDAGMVISINGVEEPYSGSAPDIGIYELYDLTSIEDESSPSEDVVKIKGVYPNPFNPITTIEYYLGKNMRVSIFVVDLLGRRIKSFADEVDHAIGTHFITWNGENEKGEPLASGVYFLVLKAGAMQRTRKVLLLK